MTEFEKCMELLKKIQERVDELSKVYKELQNDVDKIIENQ